MVCEWRVNAFANTFVIYVVNAVRMFVGNAFVSGLCMRLLMLCGLFRERVVNGFANAL